MLFKTFTHVVLVVMSQINFSQVNGVSAWTNASTGTCGSTWHSFSKENAAAGTCSSTRDSSSKPPKLKTWEYKLPIIADQVAFLAGDQAQENSLLDFILPIYNPAAASLNLNQITTAPTSAVVKDSVAFYDSPAPEFTYYNQGLLLRWRDQTDRTDLTVKNRPASQYNPDIFSDEYEDCNDLKQKLEYSVNSDGDLVKETAFDNEFKSTTSGCTYPFSSSPPGSNSPSYWTEMFPILPTPESGNDIELVNGILVTQYSLDLGLIRFPGIFEGDEIVGSLILWVDSNNEQALAGEFSYTVKKKQLQSGSTPPAECVEFLSQLTYYAQQQQSKWLADHMKTHYVYYPPSN